MTRTWGGQSPMSTSSNCYSFTSDPRRREEMIARLVFTAFYNTYSPTDAFRIPSLVHYVVKGTHKLKDLLPLVFKQYNATKPDWVHGVDCYGVSLFVVKRFIEINNIESCESASTMLKNVASDHTCGWLEARQKVLQHLIKKYGCISHKRWCDDVPIGLSYLLHPDSASSACAGAIAVVIFTIFGGEIESESSSVATPPQVEADYSIAINHVKLENVGTTSTEAKHSPDTKSDESLLHPFEGKIFRRRLSSENSNPNNGSCQPTEAIHDQNQNCGIIDRCTNRLKVFRRTKSSLTETRKSSNGSDFNDPIHNDPDSTCDEQERPRRRRSGLSPGEVKMPFEAPNKKTTNPLERTITAQSPCDTDFNVQMIAIETEAEWSDYQSPTGMGIGVFGTPIIHLDKSQNDNEGCDHIVNQSLIESDNELVQRRASRVEISNRNLRNDNNNNSDSTLEPNVRRASRVEISARNLRQDFSNNNNSDSTLEPNVRRRASRVDCSSRCLNDSSVYKSITTFPGSPKSSMFNKIPPLSPRHNRSSLRRQTETFNSECAFDVFEGIKRTSSVTFISTNGHRNGNGQAITSSDNKLNNSTSTASIFGGLAQTVIIDSESQAEFSSSTSSSKISSAKPNIQALNMTITSLSSQVSILTEQLNREEKNYESALKMLKEKDEAIHHLQEMILSLQETMCDSATTVDLRQQVQSLTEQLKSSQNEFSTFINNQAAVMGELHSDTPPDTKNNEERRKSILVTSAQQNVSLTSELTNLSRKFNEREAALLSKEKVICQQLSDAHGQINDLHQSLKQLQMEIKNEKIKSKKLHEQQQPLSPTSVTDIDVIEVDLLSVKAEVKRLRIKLTNRQEDYSTATQENDTTNRLRIELAQQLMDLDNLTQEIKDCQKKGSTLLRLKTDAERSKDFSEIDLLTIELSEQGIELNNLSNTKEVKSLRVSDLREQISRSLKKMQPEEELCSLRSEIHSLKKEINAMLHRKKNIETQLTSCRSRCSKSEASNKLNSSSEIAVLKKALLAQADLKSAADKKLESVEKMLVECKTNNTVAMSVLDRLGILSPTQPLSEIPEVCFFLSVSIFMSEKKKTITKK